MTKHGKKIVVVDDDIWLARQFAHNLEQHVVGCQVAVASNGLEAIDLIEEFGADVIVLDVFMPGPNGIVLLHELQSHSDLAKIPVILCSNSVSTMSISAERLRGYGVQRVIDKGTMVPDDLITGVRRVLA